MISLSTGRSPALVVGRTLESFTDDIGAFWWHVTGDTTAAVVNAVWDLWVKAERKPLWKLLADPSPEELVRCFDFRRLGHEAVAAGFTHVKIKVGRDLADDVPRARSSAGRSATTAG